MNSVWDTACAVGFPIRKFTDQSLLAAPRDLSQRATSFIASQCQGIHQMPFRRLISNSNENACATRRNKPAREVAVATRFRRSMLLPASVALWAQPAEERPRSLALHLHLSMIPPLHHNCGLRHMNEREALVHVHVAVLWFLPTVLIKLGRLALAPRHQPDVGGGRRDRTDDLLLAKQALSQLSYAPNGNNAIAKLGGPGRI